MGLTLPAVPNLNVAPPQIANPLDQQAKMLQLKNLMGQQQLLPLQVQEAQERVKQEQTANQMQQLQLQSQQAMVKAWSDPDVTSGVTGTNGNAAGMVGFEPGFDPNALIKKLVSKGVLPEDAIKQAGSFLELSKNLSMKTKDDLSNYKTAHEALSKLLTPIPDMSVTEASEALSKAKQQAQKIPGLDPSDVQLLQQADLEHLPALINHLGFAQDVADFHKAKAQAIAEQQKVINPATGVSPDTQQQVNKEIAVATNPQVQAGKEEVAAVEGRNKALREQQLARGSNAALANVPQHLIPPATAAATKAGEDYAQAKSVSDRINAMMDAAKKGNVVSYQLIPQEGALQVTTSQGVHRINMTEIEQYGGAGSIFQRLEGKFGKALTGQSIPDSVLKDMAEMQDVMARGSQTKYNNALKTINQSYGSDFKPVEMETLKPKEAPQHVPGGAATGLTEGATGKGSDGQKYVVKGGVWVKSQS